MMLVRWQWLGVESAVGQEEKSVEVWERWAVK
ncbi:hypothetical protein PMI31_04977 [Pseudomonas sp. GM55]|nr:hypothetical protein PMI31_04977 [Pseudomonas sp. GM55]